MNQKIIVSMSLLAALCSPAWAINKCTGADGKVVYQEIACAEGGTKVNISGAGQGDATSEGTSYYKREAAKLTAEENTQTAARERSSKISLAILNRQIVTGMTAAEARQSWGDPTKINNSIGSYGKHEQWVYERGRHRTQYVYVENGTVTSTQSPE